MVARRVTPKKQITHPIGRLHAFPPASIGEQDATWFSIKRQGCEEVDLTTKSSGQIV